jgi:hypothetical protein
MGPSTSSEYSLFEDLHVDKADGTEWKDVAQESMPMYVSQLIVDHRPCC